MYISSCFPLRFLARGKWIEKKQLKSVIKKTLEIALERRLACTLYE